MSRLLGGGCLHSPAITVGDQVNFVWNTKMDISMEVLLWHHVAIYKDFTTSMSGPNLRSHCLLGARNNMFSLTKRLLRCFLVKFKSLDRYAIRTYFFF